MLAAAPAVTLTLVKSCSRVQRTLQCRHIGKERTVPWTIEMMDLPKAVSLKATGPMKLVLIKQIAAEALAQAAFHNVRQFLVDDREMVPELSTLEIHELPATLERMGLGKRDRAAVVYNKTSPEAMDFRFFEDTARNRGFRIRLFTDMADALKWLRKGDDED